MRNLLADRQDQIIQMAKMKRFVRHDYLLPGQASREMRKKCRNNKLEPSKVCGNDDTAASFKILGKSDPRCLVDSNIFLQLLF